jgi:hypothetical protein
VNVTILVVFFVLVKNVLNQHESFAAAAGCKSYSVSVSYKYNHDMYSVIIRLIFVLLPQLIDAGKYVVFTRLEVYLYSHPNVILYQGLLMEINSKLHIHFLYKKLFF